MLKRIQYNFFESTKTTLHSHQENLTFNHPPLSNFPIFNPKQPNQGFQRLSMSNKNKRDLVMYSSVEPGPPMSSGPPNSLSWILAILIAIAVPLVNNKWGPLLKNKIETALKVTEDVVEAVEKVAEEVEKVAEDIANDLPEGGKLRKAVDFVENLAEKAAKDAGAIDDFIDEVQEEEEKAESFVESLKDEPKNPPKESNDEKPEN